MQHTTDKTDPERPGNPPVPQCPQGSPRLELTVTAPLYNEEGTAVELLERIARAVAPLGLRFEILFVLDGCVDATLDRLLEARPRFPQLRIVEFSRNFGLQSAVHACLELSRGHTVVLLDGDLQDPPELIPELVRTLRQGSDVVYTRKESRPEGPMARLCFSLFYLLQSVLARYPIPRQAGNFSCLSRRAVNTILSLPERNRYFPGLRAWIGMKSACVTYARDPRFAGEPKQSWTRLLSLALDGIFYFTDLPLKFSFLLGGLSLCCAAGLTVNVLVQKLVTHTAKLGWTSTIIAICFFAGVQLICLGILGCYVERIFAEVRGRSLYVVKKTWEPVGEPGAVQECDSQQCPPEA